MVRRNKLPDGCLASQDLRAKILSGGLVTNGSLVLDAQGKFCDPTLEARVQPASFEPVPTDEGFVLDTDSGTSFRGQADEEIWRTLLQIPSRARPRVSLADGYELKRGFTYLLPLAESIRLGANEYMRSSPKSSLGRLFLFSRLLADYNLSYDEVTSEHAADRAMRLWLLVQPLAFDLIVRPGIPLNQLRFMRGHDAKLSQSEILDEFKRNPLLYEKTTDGSRVPSIPHVTEGLRLTVDAIGAHTGGVIGLRARRNPHPIDLAEKGTYNPHEYFEPLLTQQDPRIMPGERYLLASKEVLCIPAHLSAETQTYADLGMLGPLDFAGFIDNGFEGDLVFEPQSTEIADLRIMHGMPLTYLDVYRTTQTPDKQYGARIGSNYQGQVGPRTSKHFGSFNYEFAKKEYGKLAREALVHDTRHVHALRHNLEGFEPISATRAAQLEALVKDGFFLSRYDCEDDELVQQIIPYLLLFGPNRTIFGYWRTADPTAYGEKRLFNLFSVGVGGHIYRADAPKYITKNLERERKEEVRVHGPLTEPALMGTLLASDNPVDRVHLGVVYAALTGGRISKREKSIERAQMYPIVELQENLRFSQEAETWTRVLLPSLDMLYDRLTTRP